MANDATRQAAEAEAHEWLASVTDLVVQTTVEAARPAVLEQVSAAGARLLEQCAAVRNPDLIADLHLTVATAEVELATAAPSERDDARLREAIDHCDLAVAAAMASRTTFVPAEILPWAMGTLSVARTSNPRGQEQLLDARIAGYLRDFGHTLEQMEQDRRRGSDTLEESVVLFAASDEVTDVADLRRVISVAIEQAQQARRLLASTGDFAIVRLADDHIEAMQRALRGAAARSVVAPQPAFGGAGAPASAAVDAPSAALTPEAQRIRPPARRLRVVTLLAMFGLIVAGASAYFPWAKVGALTVTPLTPGAQFQLGRLLDRGGLDAYVLLGGASLAAFLTVYSARGGLLSGVARRLGGLLAGLLIPFTIGEVLFILAQNGASLGVGIYVLIGGTLVTTLANTLGGRGTR